MTTHQDLQVKQGSTWSWTYTKLDSGGSAVDLTGYTARMSIKDAFEGSLQAYLSTEPDADGGTITLGGGAGTIILSMTATETRALGEDISEVILNPYSKKAERFETYIYDLELVSGATVTRELEGNVIVEREVTT